MKALVLSGGKGTRLRPITHTFAKQLIPIANKPILFYGLEAIAQAGIKEVGIVVQAQPGPKGLEFGPAAAEIREAVGDGGRFGLKVTYILQEAPLGLAHAVKISETFLKEEPFLMFLGDNLLKEGLNGLVREFEKEKPAAQILAVKVPNPSQFGVVEVDRGGKVVRLVEKPAKPKSDLALAGVYLFDKRVFKAISTLKPSARGELEITDAIQRLVDDGLPVLCRKVEGWWKDTGKLEDLLEANRLILEGLIGNWPQPNEDRQIVGGAGKPAAGMVLEKRLVNVSNSKIEGRVELGKDAVIKDSKIRGPVVIGPGARIENSYVGPFTSIERGVTIKDAEIEHSIVLEGAVVESVKPIHDSLIGQHVKVVRTGARPAAYRIMAGDSSQIEIP